MFNYAVRQCDQSVMKLGNSFVRLLMNVVLQSCTGDNKVLYHGAAKETRGEAAKGRHINIEDAYENE